MKKVIHNNLYMLKIFFKAVPMYSISFCLLRIARSLLFNIVGNVLFIQYIVRSVEFVLAHPEETQKTVTQLIIAACVYYGLVLLFNTVIEGIPESVNAAKNIMGTGISLSKYPNSHLQRDEMHS